MCGFLKNAAGLRGEEWRSGLEAPEKAPGPHPHRLHVQRSHSSPTLPDHRAGGPQALLQHKVTPVPLPQAPAAQHVLVTAQQGRPGGWAQRPGGPWGAGQVGTGCGTCRPLPLPLRPCPPVCPPSWIWAVTSPPDLGGCMESRTWPPQRGQGPAVLATGIRRGRHYPRASGFSEGR